jgi:hypothetical protein
MDLILSAFYGYLPRPLPLGFPIHEINDKTTPPETFQRRRVLGLCFYGITF